jgi:hypothetical protein
MFRFVASMAMCWLMFWPHSIGGTICVKTQESQVLRGLYNLKRPTTPSFAFPAFVDTGDQKGTGIMDEAGTGFAERRAVARAGTPRIVTPANICPRARDSPCRSTGFSRKLARAFRPGCPTNGLKHGAEAPARLPPEGGTPARLWRGYHAFAV